MTGGAGTWLGGAAAAAYDAGFAPRCGGTIPFILAALAGTAPEHGRLLDVGTGTGWLACAAHRAGFETTGVDPDPAMLTHARDREPRVTWVSGGAPGLPFDEATFEVAVANFVLNHVSDPLASLADVYRTVRPGGTVVATTWPVDDPLNAFFAEVAHRAQVVAAPTPGGYRPSTAADLHHLHTACGAVALRSGEWAWDFVIDPHDLWTAVRAGVASAGRTFLSQDTDGGERYTRAYWSLVTALLVDGALRLRVTAPFAIGRRSSGRLAGSGQDGRRATATS